MRFAFWCLPLVLVIWPIFAGALSENDAVDIVTGYDPGLCNKTNHGKLKLVKNREDEDSLFICAQVKGVFKWKTTDGSMTLGEFISPGYDCADILNKNFNAKDGFYWIHLNEATPKKVWCDMTTDGGGFILFGYQNSSVTWDIPSTNKPVDPFGSPRWSSVLGNTPILDIRVQVSSSAEFKDTKAHWSYRLNSKRPLKNLMLLGEKGCDANSPGIGDVAHVKDLMMEKIVTTNFRCAKFGVPYHAGTKFGWASMNSCLQSPCRLGFAYISDLPVQIDYYGAFSYSVNGPVSGTAYNSTSFVGCDKGKCCACFGPYGGAKDYCSDQCQAINGGTVLKNIHVWFWVRSTMPKNVWTKCMEFQRRGDNNQLEWFKLINGNPTPVKGRCDQRTVLLNDGVAVVPSDKPLPDITGLLAFRKDTDRLYLRSRDAWRRIADQRKISQLENELRNARSALTQENSNLQRQINAKGSEISNLQGQLNTKNTEVSSLQRQINSKGNEISNLQGQLNTKNTEVSNLQRQMSAKGNEISRLRIESRNARSSQARQISSLQGQLNTKNTEVRNLNTNQVLLKSLLQYHTALRLVDGGSKNRGRVEVYRQEYGWGSVCDDEWDIDDGHVVCRQLGYRRATNTYHDAHYGQAPASYPTLLDDLECTGSESYLWECPHRGWNVENCSHSEDASVDCE